MVSSLVKSNFLLIQINMAAPLNWRHKKSACIKKSWSHKFVRYFVKYVKIRKIFPLPKVKTRNLRRDAFKLL